VILDLFCGAGGAAMGYHQAGFDVIGVDIEPQPRYPFRFVQGDALDVLAGRDLLPPFDAIHASPPCQDHSPLKSRAGEHGTGWMLDATRRALVRTGLPCVIENVMAADMRPDLVLCGEMFGLRTIRHRQFEVAGFPVMSPPHSPHVARTATSRRRERWARGWHVSITGDVGTYVGPEAMGIDWMTGDELSQAIPPAYTRFIGEQLRDHLAHAEGWRDHAVQGGRL
jgi:DNA (cytosine-5)-methyltransferase 1